MSLSERINDTNCAPWVIEEIRKLETERDALAAHIERCRALLDEALPCHGVEADHELLCVLSDVLEEQSPATSLTRLKAQWQAEALERAIKVMRQPFKEGGQPWLVHVEDLQAMADDYRRQAEEDMK